MKDFKKSKAELLEELAALKEKLSDAENLKSQLIDNISPTDIKKASRVITTSKDFSYRRQLTDEYNISKARYRSNVIVNDMMDVIIRWSPDGTISFVNHAFCRYYSISENEVSGANLQTVFNGELKKIYDFTLSTMSPTNPIIEQDFKIILPEKLERWQHIRSRGIFNKKGKLLSVQSVARDMTLIKSMVEALEASKAEWENTFNAMEDWIALVDMESCILQTNEAGENITGIARSGLIGKKCCSILHNSDTRIEQCPMNRMFQSKKRESAEFQIGERWFSITVDPVIDSAGNISSAVHIIRDITEKKKSEEERERLIDQLSQALAEVKKLSGLLPICSFCKKIRDDKGYWNQIEEYIGEHSEVEFTHGFCPECAKKMYSEFLDDDDEFK